jgi:hypothetical protein
VPLPTWDMRDFEAADAARSDLVGLAALASSRMRAIARAVSSFFSSGRWLGGLRFEMAGDSSVEGKHKYDAARPAGATDRRCTLQPATAGGFAAFCGTGRRARVPCLRATSIHNSQHGYYEEMMNSGLSIGQGVRRVLLLA